MKHQLRSATSTGGRRMAGARALWRANGMKETEMGNPIIAIVNSFTQFVPGHVHRDALLAPLARNHRRQRRIYGQCTQGRCDDLYQQLR